MLDFVKLLPRIHDYVDRHAERDAELSRAIQAARDQLEASSADWEAWRERVRAAQTSWLVGEPLEQPGRARALPDLADEYVALATDGSQIAPDRHEVAGCWLVNVGTVALRYGPAAAADLQSLPMLLDADDDLLATDDAPLPAGTPDDSPAPPAGAGDKAMPGGSNLALRRHVEECRALARMICAAPKGIPAVAMVDGTLIPWSAESAYPAVKERIVAETQALLNVGREHGVPVVGYISRPGSRDVVNATRVARCPYDPPDCGRHCARKDPRLRDVPCAGVEAATDALLFERLLGAGERSGCFASSSKILNGWHDNHIAFCYLAAGLEIARLEVPRWVLDDPAMLDLAHAAAFDQIGKGGGYPRVLTEAHELAVVRGPERAMFFRQIEDLYVRRHVPARVTRKALSKRIRGV